MSTNYSRTPTGIYNVTPPVLKDGDFAEPQLDENGKLRVNAEITVNISAAQEVIISAEDDSIRVEDGNGNVLAINNDGSINLGGLNDFQTSQYTVGTSAVQLTPTPLANRSSLSIKVTTVGGGVVYIGNSSGVTTANGYPMFSGDSLQLDLNPGQVAYAIASLAGQTVYALEVG